MEDFDIISALNLPFHPHGPSQASHEDLWLSTELGLLAEPLDEECPESVDGLSGNSSGPSQNAQPSQTTHSWFLEQSLQQQLALQHMLAGSFVSPAPEASVNAVPQSSSPTLSKSTSKRTPLDEDEKRRRNTEASARFRAKKKQKESALLQSAKAMEEKVAALEKRNQELELEIKWLRKLVLERDGPNGLQAFCNMVLDFSTADILETWRCLIHRFLSFHLRFCSKYILEEIQITLFSGFLEMT